MSYTEVVDTVETPDGMTYRALIVQDEDPMAPEFDGGCPIVQIDPGHYDGFRAEMTSYGQCSEFPDGLPDTADRILQRFNAYDKRTAIDTFERYLRIYHDGNLVEWSSGDCTYIAYVTRTLWESWGNAGEVGKADLDEWRAYVEGDVYSVIVEELTTWTKDVPCADREGRVSDDIRETWETVDSCGGFYGYKYAEESARDQLAYFSERQELAERFAHPEVTRAGAIDELLNES